MFSNARAQRRSPPDARRAFGGSICGLLWSAVALACSDSDRSGSAADAATDAWTAHATSDAGSADAAPDGGARDATADAWTADGAADARTDDAALDAGTGDSALDASGTDAALCQPRPEQNGPYTQITIRGNPGAKGAIDPSVVYPADAPSALMTYTSVPDEAHDFIAIARSDDAGASWQYVGAVTSATSLTISTGDMEVCGRSTCSGTFAHESSSLIVDPSDPNPDRRLKVFLHSYFFGSERQLELGYLALYSAAAPEGPWTETKLFGWDSDSPISTQGVRYNISEDPELSELRTCLILGEPGALYRAPGIIDLSLSCVALAGGNVTIDIRLLRSRDHGQTWSFVSNLLTAADATALGSTRPEINGSALFHANGRYSLIVTPSGLVDFPDGPAPGYRGCVVVPIADLEAGTVQRCDGKPAIEVAYRGQPGQFVGACSANVGPASRGMLIPVPDFSDPSGVSYRIFAAAY